MAAETPAQSSPVASLFQKAHGRMVMLQRVDEQLAGLIDQRQKLQDELRHIQSQINEEFDRVMEEAQKGPVRLLTQIADGVHGNGSRRLEVEDAVA